MPASRSASADVGVVIVDADPAQRRVLSGILERDRRLSVSAHASADGLSRRSASARGRLVIADLETVGGPGRLVEAITGDDRLIATSHDASLQTAVAALRNGAYDFLPKPFGARALLDKVQAALREDGGWRRAGAVAGEPPQRPRAIDGDGAFERFVGRSPVMQAAYRQIRLVARSAAPVFITGESGTGKELCAAAIHRQAAAADPRRERPFVALNCSAIPSELMESEMFGHVRGAFTGASGERIGAAELADGGTLFLDEIAEMDTRLQAKLLRFLQSGEIRPVGSTATRKVTVRIVCATNRDPAAEMAAGRFRADLFYRLHVLPVEMPPLRARGDDVMLLAEDFRRRFAAEERKEPGPFSGAALERLRAHDWPGNVRELANVVRRMVVFGEGDELGTDLLPPDIMDVPPAAGPRDGPGDDAPAEAVRPLWLEERRAIERALAVHDGHVGRAAAALEVDPSTIYRKRQAWRAHDASPGSAG